MSSENGYTFQTVAVREERVGTIAGWLVGWGDGRGITIV